MADDAVTPTQALGQLRELLGMLEPEDEIVLVDVMGREHHVRTTIPARRHIQVLRQFDALVEQARQVAPLGFAGDNGAGVGRVVAALRLAIRSEALVEQVGVIFATAYPGLVNEAAPEGARLDPLEVFPLESVLQGLVPLLSRLIVKALAVIEKAELSQATQPGT